jgi:hypothetical protein
VCRKVQQTSLGNLVGVLSKEATTLGMRFQEVRIHGITPLETDSTLAQRIGSI